MDPVTVNKDKLPGRRLLAIAGRVFEESVRTAVVDQTIADLRVEWLAAESLVGRAKARWLGYLAFWSLVAVAPFALGRKQRRARVESFWRMDMTLGTKGRVVALCFVLGLAAGWTYGALKPSLYRSTAVLQLRAANLASDVAREFGVTATPLAEVLQPIRQTVLSRTRLERLLTDHNLFEAERKSLIMEEVIARFRDDIQIDIDESDRGRAFGQIMVSFVATNPQTAMRVTEKLTSFIIDEHLVQAERRAEGTHAFLESQVEEARRKLEAMSTEADGLKARPSQARRLELEVTESLYKSLLASRAQAAMRVNLANRQMGDQLVLIDPARLPERPIGPTRFQYTLAGGAAALALASIVGLLVAGRRLGGKRQKLAEAPTA